MKKNNYLLLVALLFFSLLLACSDKDLNSVPQEPSEDEINFNKAKAEASFTSDAVILGIVDGKTVKALNLLLSNSKSQVDENTRLLIVPDLSSKYEKELTTVYSNGGIIAVLNPTKNNFDAWFASHDWVGYTSDIDIDGDLVYSFNSAGHSGNVIKPNDPDVFVDEKDAAAMADSNDADFIFGNLLDDFDEAKVDEENNQFSNLDGGDIFNSSDNEYSDTYIHLRGWMRMIEEYTNRNLMNFSINEGEAENEEVSNLFGAYHYSISLPFSAKREIRKLIGSNPDFIEGSGTVDICFDIYQIHCYEEENGSGDYYLVNMNASVANADMYKGKWWNQHGGCYVRMCGFFGRTFQISCEPIDEETKRPIETTKLMFTEGTTPSPVTTVGSTSYENNSSFSLNTGCSISGSKGSKSSINGKLDVSLGWAWSKKETRSIMDTDICNNITGNKVRYSLNFHNLPKYYWGKRYGIEEGPSLTYRSTSELRSSWVWYMKDVKDDSTLKPISIRVCAKPTYGALSFISTKADLHEDTFEDLVNVEHIFKLSPFVRDRCSAIILHNDFQGNISIKNIQIYKSTDTKKEDLLWEYKTTIKPNEQIKTSALKIADSYAVYFTTTQGHVYKYNSYPELELELGSFKDVYAAVDFTQIE